MFYAIMFFFYIYISGFSDCNFCTQQNEDEEKEHEKILKIVEMVAGIINETVKEDGVVRRMVYRMIALALHKNMRPISHMGLMKCGSDVGRGSQEDKYMVKILSNMLGGPKLMFAFASVMSSGRRGHGMGPSWKGAPRPFGKNTPKWHKGMSSGSFSYGSGHHTMGQLLDKIKVNIT